MGASRGRSAFVDASFHRCIVSPAHLSPSVIVKVLVTGATGFIGSVLTRQLVEAGADVRILRRATSRLTMLADVAHRVEHAVGDVTDPPGLAQAMQGVRQVYHTAGYIGFGGRRDRALLFRVNVQGTANVVNAALAAGVERLVHTSSISAFSRPEAGGAIDEETAWNASRVNTDYARSKYEAELEVYRGVAEGLDAVMVNPSLVFGVGRPGENTRLLAERIRDGKVPAIPIGGTNVVDVEDVAAGHVRAMAHGRTGERYLLGGDNLSWKAILETLAFAFGVPPPRRMASPMLTLALATVMETFALLTRRRPQMTREMARQTAHCYTYDNRKAITELGCTFRPFEATAHRIAAVLG